MLHAVIDIGSNTIRLSVYDCSRKDKIVQKAGGRAIAGLAACTKDGALTREGIEKVCDALNGFRDILSEHNPESLFVFATASLRNVSNTAEAVEAVRKETGFHIEILPGEEEAMLDFAGAMLGTDVSDGLVVDIGGGSSELIRFCSRSMRQAASLPVGSLKLYKGYVRGLLPTYEETAAIRRETARLLEKAGMKKEVCKTVLGVGGTLRHSARLCAAAGCGSADGFAVNDFKNLLNLLCTDSTYAEDILRRITPDRVDSMLPGMLLFGVIADYFSCERVEISMFGVREGYLIEKILKMNIDENV